MKPHLERRKSDRDPADTLSPECLALLVSCGDEIRATDQIEMPPVVTPVRRSRRREDYEVHEVHEVHEYHEYHEYHEDDFETTAPAAFTSAPAGGPDRNDPSV